MFEQIKSKFKDINLSMAEIEIAGRKIAILKSQSLTQKNKQHIDQIAADGVINELSDQSVANFLMLESERMLTQTERQNIILFKRTIAKNL